MKSQKLLHSLSQPRKIKFLFNNTLPDPGITIYADLHAETLGVVVNTEAF